MDEIWARLIENLTDRISGPMKFRLLLQPVMASIFAVRAGLNDARAGKPIYFWALLSDPAHRADAIKDGWKGIGKVLILAVLLDVVYQHRVALRVSGGSHHRRVRPGGGSLPDSARPGQSYRFPIEYKAGSRMSMDDAAREWAYDRESSIGKLDRGLDEALAKGWTVVSVKDDWKAIFPPEKVITR